MFLGEMTDMPHADKKVASITITYNPDIDVLKAQLAALFECMYVVVVDNGSETSVVNEIKSAVSAYGNTRMVALTNNKGIAAAQNLGVKIALEAVPSIQYLLFLDHDTIPDKYAISTLVSNYAALKNNKNTICAIGPRLIDPRSQSEYGFHKFSFPLYKKIKISESQSPLVQCDFLNSSGTLVGIKEWEVVGTYDESFFIDFVDTEWCFRARSKGYLCFGDFSAVAAHEIGDFNLFFWFFGARSVPYRKPERHYYIFRNAIKLMKRPYVPLWWKVLCLVKLVSTIVVFSIFSGDRFLQLRKIFLGVRDGVLSKSRLR